MSVTRSSGYSTSNTGSSVTTYDMDTAGIAVGDWAIIAILGSLTAGTWTSSLSGWTTLVAPTTLGTRRGTVLARKRLTGDTSTFTFTSNAANSQRGVLVGVSGAADVASWGLGAFTTRATMGSDGFHNIIPGVTTATNDNLIVTVSFEATTVDEAGAKPAVANATEWVFVGQAGAGTTIETVGYYYSTKATPGATATVTTTHPNIQVSNGAGIQIAIPGADLRGPGLTLYRKTAGGTEAVQLYKVTAAGVRTPSSAVVVPSGYPNVTTMLATANFKVAHRGGSASFPEMSLHAYTQSVVRNYKALEISLARTSDGVWFGLHDATLDRTSGVTGVTASALTWAQVQAYSITIGPGAARPYMRLEEVLRVYGTSHVLFLDPKSAISFRTELLNKARDFYGSDSEAAKHCVAKYYGLEGNVGGTTGWAADARARGWKTWGYFYEAEYTAGTLATYQGRWDILGMDYNASGAAWTAVKSYGKPVIAHIIPNTTGYATAQALTPSGYMVSGTALVPA